MAATSSSSSSNTEFKYDVFISFRGEDTRYTFTSHLHAALCRRKIETFIDFELKRGDEISPALIKAIHDSSLSILVLSKDYASSSWCLDELLKILECNYSKGQIVVPVFYHVLPSDVRKQTRSYGEAFAKHGKTFKKAKGKLQRWRDALTQVANLSGWHLQSHDERPESELIEKIVDDVLDKLNLKSSCDLDGLVGMGSRIESVESLLCVGSTDVRFVGIWGMGGNGKTTLARAIFSRITNQFEGSCFLENIREDSANVGIHQLRSKLLSEILEGGNLNRSAPDFGSAFTKNRLLRKKVLVVLDDVNDSQQLKYLAGNHGWFGPGSRIIITSRDKQVLKNDVDDIYELKELNYHDTLRLFSLNAFKKNQPTNGFMEVSTRVLHYAQGNPLALKVFGCFLFGRSKREWESTLKKLKKSPNMNIQNVMRISYDGLDDEEKQIFLDITCFFKGEERYRVELVLDGCGFSSEIGISVLVEKCLINITESNCLAMHDLIQEMGYGIVRQESIEEPGKRSRLWDPADIYNMFNKNSGTEAIRSISFDLSQIGEIYLRPDAFRRMEKLRFLKFYRSPNYLGYRKDAKLNLCQGLDYLPDELRYLHWERYTLKSMPSKLNIENLVELRMTNSSMEYLWKDKKHLVNLKRIDLSGSEHLIEIPCLTSAPNIESVNLCWCSRITVFPEFSWNSNNIKTLVLTGTAIEEVPSAIGCLNKLEELYALYCRRLKNLPSEIRNLTSLKKLILKFCPNITAFPSISGDLKYLTLEGTGIEEVSSSIDSDLPKLVGLNLRDCTSLRCLPSSIFMLKSLENLFLGHCSKLDVLPEILEMNMGKLFQIDLDGTPIKELPSSIDHLLHLSQLYMGDCESLATLPNSFSNLTSLTDLRLSDCSGVDKLLANLPPLSGLCSLESLNLNNCNLLEFPSAFVHSSSLVRLELEGNNFESLCLKSFSHLNRLVISQCKKLKYLQDFPSPCCLETLHAADCISLQTLRFLEDGNLIDDVFWKRFIFSNCLKLDETAGRNILEYAWLRIQDLASRRRRTTRRTAISCVPGSEIPKWFINENEGSSIKINLPPNWSNGSDKFLGFALCVVVASEDYNENNGKMFSIETKCDFEIRDSDCNYNICSDLNCSDHKYQPVFLTSDHVFMLYDHMFYPKTIDGDHMLSIYQSCHKASFVFSLVDRWRQPLLNWKVKKCGVQLLYSEDECVESSIETKIVPNDGSCDEEEEDPKSKISKEIEPKSEAQGRVKLISKIFLVGLVMFFLWCFLFTSTCSHWFGYGLGRQHVCCFYALFLVLL